MSQALVIVESPAKAKTIGKFLGKNYKVVASNGHVRDLPKSQLGVDPKNGFEPKYITLRGRGDVLEKIRKEAKKSDKIYLATDPDREGEAISWHLAHILKLDPAAKCRIVFNEITSAAVKNSIKGARPIDMRLVDAQQARRVLDRLVGYKISPILWAKVRKGLSAGRVQSVATRIICDREQEILDFIPEEYWTIAAHLQQKGSRRELRRMGKNAGRSNLNNLAITTVEGIGLGALGIGLPDIVLFIGTLLKGVYETALHYGYAYDTRAEQMLILKMLAASLSGAEDWERRNEAVDRLLARGAVPATDEVFEAQIQKTASAFALDMLVLKFIQGLPVVGVLGGAANPVYYRKIMRYVQLKYRKRYLWQLLKREQQSK